MLSHKLLLTAILLEISAWSIPRAVENHSDLQLLSYLLVHLLASILIAIVASALFRTRTKPQRRWLIMLTAGFCYAIPVGGFIGMLLGILMLRMERRAVAPEPFDSIELPEFDPHQQHQSATFRQTGLRSLLNNTNVPMTSRLGAMVALQNVSGRISSPLLRNVLTDPSEDIRLLAYGMLDNQEKRINKAIDEQLKVFAAHEATKGTPYYHAAQLLSDHYWELVYQELALGDLRNYAIGESLRYCDLVLEHNRDNAALTLRKGRLLHALGKPNDAREAYLVALALGLPAVRVLPYLAEINFESRNFDELDFLIEELSYWSALPKLRPLIDYWRPA